MSKELGVIKRDFVQLVPLTENILSARLFILKPLVLFPAVTVFLICIYLMFVY